MLLGMILLNFQHLVKHNRFIYAIPLLRIVTIQKNLSRAVSRSLQPYMWTLFVNRWFVNLKFTNHRLCSLVDLRFFFQILKYKKSTSSDDLKFTNHHENHHIPPCLSALVDLTIVFKIYVAGPSCRALSCSAVSYHSYFVHCGLRSCQQIWQHGGMYCSDGTQQLSALFGT